MSFRLRLIALLCISTIQGCDNFQAEVVVGCETIDGGVSCLVERKSGAKRVDACWSVAFVCVNGTKMQYETCAAAPVALGEKYSKIFAWSELGNYEDCEKISAMSVENLSVK